MIVNKLRMLFAPEDDGSGGPNLGGFADDDPPETEIITLGPGEEAPKDDDDDGVDTEHVTLTKEEFEELKNGSNSANVLASSLSELKDVLKGPQQPANGIQQQPGESDEEFEKRLESDLFAEGKSAKAIQEAIQRYGGGQTAQLMSMISAQNKRLLQMDDETGPTFKRYKGEIENFVGQLPAEQQNHPQVWEYAFKQVKEKHAGELESERVNSQVDELVNKRLKEMGLDEDAIKKLKGGNGSSSSKSAPYMETGRGAANVGSGGSGKKRKVYATAEDKEIARIKGVPLEQYLKKKGKM